MGYLNAKGGVTSPLKQHHGRYEYYLTDANGNRIKDSDMTIQEYWEYENDPSGDKPTKVTNDRDVYGRKCGGSPSNPKICEGDYKPSKPKKPE